MEAVLYFAMPTILNMTHHYYKTRQKGFEAITVREKHWAIGRL